MSATQHAPQAQRDAAALRAAGDGAGRADETTLVDVDGTVRPLPGPLHEGALLVVDVQRSFADPAYLPWLDEAGLAAVDAAVTRTGWLVDQARAAGVPVVWVALEQLPDEPWSTSLWLRGLDAAAWPEAEEPCVVGTPGAEWFGVAPLAGETVVPKRRYSGFLGTGLEAHLRESGVTWVVAAGLTSECCVDGTVRDAFQLGFRAVMTSDATAAYDAQTHTHALTVLAENAAVVATSASVAAAWTHAATAAATSAPPSATAPSPSTVAVAEPIPAGRP